MQQFSIPLCLPQTRSFYLACAIVAIIVSWMVYRLRARQRASLRNAILAAQLSERERIARALHDSWLQNIHGLVLSLASSVRMVPEDSAVGEHLRKLLVRSDEVMLEGRQEIMGLRNSLLKPDDLHDALAVLGARLQQQFGVTFVMEK
jgi:signal transduction histidine kinase